MNSVAQQRGAALVIAVVISAALGALGVVSNLLIKEDIALLSELSNQQQAQLDARSGVYKMIYMRLTSRAALRYEGAMPSQGPIVELPKGWNIANKEFAVGPNLTIRQQSLAATVPLTAALRQPAVLYEAFQA